MRFVIRFWYLFVTFILLFAATFLIQLTEHNPVSHFLIEWAKTWSTVIGALAAVVIVLMALVTYFDQRKIRLLETKSKLDVFTWKAITAWATACLSCALEGELLTKDEHNTISDMLYEIASNKSDFSNLAKMFGDNKMEELVELLIKSTDEIGTYLLLHEINKTPIKRSELWERMIGMSELTANIINYKI